MNPEQSAKALQKLGLSALVITGATLIFFGILAYKTALETKKLKLEIKKLKKEEANATT